MTTNVERILEQLAEAGRERGEVVANLRNLGRNFDRHCDDDERRHKENLGAFKDVSGAFKEVNVSLGGLRDSIERLSARLNSTDANLETTDDKVAAIKPIVDGYQLTKARLIGVGLTLSLVVSAGGWILVEVGKLALGTLVKKIGGG